MNFTHNSTSIRPRDQGRIQGTPQSLLCYIYCCCQLAFRVPLGVISEVLCFRPKTTQNASKMVSVSTNQSSSFNCKWLPTREATILEGTLLANQSSSFNCKWLFMEGAIFEAPICKMLRHLEFIQVTRLNATQNEI